MLLKMCSIDRNRRNHIRNATFCQFYYIGVHRILNDLEKLVADNLHPTFLILPIHAAQKKRRKTWPTKHLLFFTHGGVEMCALLVQFFVHANV